MTDSREYDSIAVASVDEIRASFPALGRSHLKGPIGYFDAPGGTQVPDVVAEAVTEQLLRHNANAHWAYETSRELDEVLAESRASLADLVRGKPSEIVFGPNMTTLTFHLARAIGRSLSPSDEIIVTDLDHQANVAPWKALIRDFGVVVRTIPMTTRTKPEPPIAPQKKTPIRSAAGIWSCNAVGWSHQRGGNRSQATSDR